MATARRAKQASLLASAVSLGSHSPRVGLLPLLPFRRRGGEGFRSRASLRMRLTTSIPSSRAGPTSDRL